MNLKFWKEQIDICSFLIYSTHETVTTKHNKKVKTCQKFVDFLYALWYDTSVKKCEYINKKGAKEKWI